MKRTILNLALTLSLALTATLFSGCASTVGINDDQANGFAYVKIDGSDPALIKAAAIEVFSREEGFAVISDTGNQVRFTKHGSKATTILYGTSFNTDSTTIEPELSIVTLNDGNHRLHCEVYVIEHMNDGEVKPGWRIVKNGQRGYMKLLKRVKSLSEPK
ncbi:MAG: putative small secreted protein [Lentimonas sp.]|jgi:predicted small secreted protein